MTSIRGFVVCVCLLTAIAARYCLAVSDFEREVIRPGEIQEDAQSVADAELAAMLMHARSYAEKYYTASEESEETRKAYRRKAEEIYRKAVEKFPRSGYAYYQLASLLTGADEIDSRIEHLEKAIEVDPKMKEAYESLGLAYIRKNNHDKAIATFRKAVESVDESLPFYLSLADAYGSVRRTKEAEESLLEACQRHATSPEAWFKLIELYVGTREPGKADETLEKALKATNNSFRLLRDVRSLYVRWKDDQKALAVLTRTLELYPESPQMWAQLIHHYLAHGEKEKAKEAVDKAIRRVRYEEDFFTAVAGAYANASDWDAAIAVLTEGTKYHPGSVEIWRTLAQLHDQKGERQKARECYQKILSMEPTRIQERRLLAISYLAEKDYEQAIQEFLRAIRLFPNDIRLKVDAANAYLASGRFEEGEKIYLDLVKAQPGNSDMHLLLANYYYKANKPDKMHEAIQAAVQVEKEPAKQARIYALMGQAALEKSDIPTALNLLQEAVNKQPNNALHVYVLARAHLLANDREKAVEHLAKATKLTPTPNPEWLLTLGQTYRALGKKEEAAESFSNAIAVLQQNCEKDPKNWLPWYQVGLAYERAENDPLASEAYAECVRLQPENGDLRYKLATVYSGLHQHQKAQKQLEAAVHLPSPKAEWFVSLGEVYSTLTKRTEASQAFENGIAILREQQSENPQDFAVWSALGEAYSRAKRYAEAIEALRKAVELAGEKADFRVHVALARALDASGQGEVAKGEYQKAVALLEKATERNPNDSDSYVRLGIVCQSLRDFAKSTEALSKAVELAGGGVSYTSVMALAESLDKSGDSEAARVQYEKAYSLLSERLKEHPKDVYAHYMLANACDKLNKLDECEREYKTAMELDPFLAASYNNLAYTWIDRNLNLEEAMNLVRKALDLEPENGAYIDSLGWGYFQQGKLDEALAELQRALKFENTDPTIYDHIGDVYKAKKMIKEAVEYWQEALEMNPNDRKIREKIEENQKALPPVEKESQPPSSG